MAASLFDENMGIDNLGKITPEMRARIAQMAGFKLPTMSGTVQPQLESEPVAPNGDPTPQTIPDEAPPTPAPVKRRSLADVLGPGKITKEKIAGLIPAPGGDENSPTRAASAQLVNLFDKQSKGIDDNESTLDLYRRLGSQDNLKPLMGLIDSYTGSNLAKDYQAPENPEQRLETMAKLQNYVQGQRNALSKDVSTVALGGLKNDTASERAMIALANRDPSGGANAHAAKMAAKLPTDYYKSIDPAFATGEFKNLAQRYQKNQAVQTILSNNPGGDLDERQYTTVAMGLAGIENNSNRVAQRMIEHLIPNNIGGLEAKVKEFFTNDRYTGERQKFLSQLQSDLNAENYTTRKQIADNISSHEPVFMPSFSQYAPGAMEPIKRAVMKKYGIKDLEMPDYMPTPGGMIQAPPAPIPAGPPPNKMTLEHWNALSPEAKKLVPASMRP